MHRAISPTPTPTVVDRGLLPGRSVPGRLVARIAILVALCLAGGCKKDGDGFVVVVAPGGRPPVAIPTPRSDTPVATVVVDFSFRSAIAPWRAVFADYPADRASLVRAEARSVPLPQGLGEGDGLLLAAQGDPAGLFTGIWRQVDGLRPHTSYRTEFSFTLAANLARACGVAARSGERHVVKAGAAGVVPEPSGMATLRLPLDKGNPTGSGRNMVVAGDLAIAGLSSCAPDNRFRTKTFRSDGRGPIVATDSLGRLWLVLGVETGRGIGQHHYILDGRFSLSPVR